MTNKNINGNNNNNSNCACSGSEGCSKVFFTDFRCEMDESSAQKLKRLIKAAGIEDLAMDGKFVAIKMHFGELGNMSFLRPNYAKAVVDTVKDLGGKPFLTDCNTMYPGYRKNAIEHLYCAWENGFTPLSAGCPIIIGDGLKGTDDVAVPVAGGEYIKEAKIGRAIMDADVFISLSHFKGHEMTGFGGAIKNIGMGCGSRTGKTEQHSNGKPEIDADMCRGCKRCLRECANNGLHFNEETRKMTVNLENCVGCGRCIGACSFNAISFEQDAAIKELNCRMAEYAKAVVDGRPCFHISIVRDISPLCDCHPGNDVPILPNIGMFASFDPLALDQACVDACLKQEPLPNTQLTEHMHGGDGKDKGECDYFEATTPNSEYKTCLAHAEKIGLGNRKYELVNVK
ncbi:MAG: DUF362 domain-containing protein [Synergistaceae bacterium]|nr:DUF362 domain-containing protein [Bacillota bacterium]MBR0315904.1 DUF362 domain-containing protein [Synergistaceae bacterium]